MFTRSQVPGRTKGKMAVDILMTAVLLGLMTYSFIGEKAHERLGMAMVFLFILHLILNRSWFLGLGRGKYTPYRVFQTMITILIFSTMIGSMVSGILISQSLFSGWTQRNVYEAAAMAHLFCAYWGFILMSAHIGLHWRMIQGIMKSRMSKELPPVIQWILRIFAAGVVVYGAYAFFHNRYPSYLFLKTHFVMYDFDATLGSVLFDEITVMGLFLCLAYTAGGVLQRIWKRKGEK